MKLLVPLVFLVSVSGQNYWPGLIQNQAPRHFASNPSCPYMIQSLMPTMPTVYSEYQHNMPTANYGYQYNMPRMPTAYPGYQPNYFSNSVGQLQSNFRIRPTQTRPQTHGCRGCGPNCVAHCSCPEMAMVRQAMRMGWPLEEVLRLGRHD